MVEFVKTWFPFVFLACLSALSADESPSGVADVRTLSLRLAELEARVTKLESPQPVKAEAAKPILEVHSETWCGPCQRFKADVAARSEIPVEIRYVKFSDRVPAFRWTDSAGKTVTRTGYASGSLQSLFDDILTGR